MASAKPDNKTLVFILVTLGVTLAGGVLGAVFATGWKGASVTAALADLLLLGWVVWRRDSNVGRLMLLGLAAGFIELLTADPFAVNNGTLHYVPGGPFLVDTPLYMPFSWIAVITQIGYLGWWAVDRWNLWKATLISAVVGAVNIPVYEILAQFAKTWYYANTPMIFGAPYYVILGELLIGAVIPGVVTLAIKKRAGWVPVLGVALGLWMWIGAIISYNLVG